MNKYEKISIVSIAVINGIFTKTVLASVGVGFLLLTIILMAIYEEVKKQNTDDYRE